MPAAADVLCPTLCRLPGFPPIASRVLGLLSTYDSPTTEIAALIVKDAGFAAALLSTANSAAFCNGGEIRTLSQAVAHLGFSRLRAITLTVAIRSVMKLVLNRPAARQCWAHSLACALIAKRFSRHAMLPEDEAYTIGLLHDVGRLGILSLFPDEYGRLLDRKYAGQAELLSAEQSAFGVDHCAAGAWLIEQWDLTDKLHEAAASHHREPTAAGPPAARLMHVACRTSNCLGFGLQCCTDSIDKVLVLAGEPLANAITAELPELKEKLLAEMLELRLA